jgi:hypothetical protein
MMTATQEPKRSDAKTDPKPRPNIDPAAPAGSDNSLGEESIRDGRPSTDDSIVEAIDEETPVTPGLPDR